MTRSAAITILLLLVPVAAWSQAVQPGDEVRIRTSAASGRFFVTALSPDGLALRDSAGSSMVVPFAAMRELSLYRGKRSPGRAFLRGAGLGAAAGAAVGAILGFASGDDPPGTFIAFTAEEKAAGAGLFLGGVGFLVGGVTGLLAPGESWERVPVAHAVDVVPAAGGIGLGVTLRF